MSQVTQTLHVTAMSCKSCVRHVEQALGALGGTERVTVDLDREQVTVAYRPDATSMAEIEAAMRRAGNEVVGQVEPSRQRARTNCCGCCG